MGSLVFLHPSQFVVVCLLFQVDIYLDGEFVGEMKHDDVSQKDVCASPPDTEEAGDTLRGTAWRSEVGSQTCFHLLAKLDLSSYHIVEWLKLYIPRMPQWEKKNENLTTINNKQQQG